MSEEAPRRRRRRKNTLFGCSSSSRTNPNSKTTLTGVTFLRERRVKSWVGWVQGHRGYRTRDPNREPPSTPPTYGLVPISVMDSSQLMQENPPKAELINKEEENGPFLWESNAAFFPATFSHRVDHHNQKWEYERTNCVWTSYPKPKLN